MLRYLDRRMSEALSHAVQVSDPANSRAWDEWLNEAFSSPETTQPEPKSDKILPPVKSPATAKSGPTKSAPAKLGPTPRENKTKAS